MNNKHRYQDTFAQVRFTGRFVPEEMAKKDRADLFALDGQICGAGGEIRFGMENGEIKIQTVHIPATEWGIYVPLQP